MTEAVACRTDDENRRPAEPPQFKVEPECGLPEWALPDCSQDAGGVYVDTICGRIYATHGATIWLGANGHCYVDGPQEPVMIQHPGRHGKFASH